MLDLLLAMLVALAVVSLVLRWAVKVEQRADDRQLTDRVYYPTRGRKADVLTLRRRRAIKRRQMWYGRNENGEPVDSDAWQGPDP